MTLSVGVGLGMVTFLHLHLRAPNHLMSNSSHQLYLLFCGCGHDLFALKSTLSVGMGVTIGCCLLVLALNICVGIGCGIVGCGSRV